MFHATLPLTFGPDEVWLFGADHLGTVAARVAVTARGGFVLLPCEDFTCSGLVPVWPETGEPVPGLRWAGVADLEAFPGVFQPH